MLSETRILIADSLEIVRVSLERSILDICPDHHLIQAETGNQVIDECRRAPIDLLLLDMSLKSTTGIETLRKVKHEWPKTKVLIQYSHDNQPQALQAIGLGADAAIPRNARSKDFTTAVLAMTAGYAVIKGELISGLMGLRPEKVRMGNFYGLTRREIEVMIATMRNESTRLVSEALCISPRTVETHRAAIYRKTGCKNLAELHEIALQFQETTPVTDVGYPAHSIPVSKLRNTEPMKYAI